MLSNGAESGPTPLVSEPNVFSFATGAFRPLYSKYACCRVRFARPAGFVTAALASSAIAMNAPPIAWARAPGFEKVNGNVWKNSSSVCAEAGRLQHSPIASTANTIARRPAKFIALVSRLKMLLRQYPVHFALRVEALERSDRSIGFSRLDGDFEVGLLIELVDSVHIIYTR